MNGSGRTRSLLRFSPHLKLIGLGKEVLGEGKGRGSEWGRRGEGRTHVGGKVSEDRDLCSTRKYPNTRPSLSKDTGLAGKRERKCCTQYTLTTPRSVTIHHVSVLRIKYDYK